MSIDQYSPNAGEMAHLGETVANKGDTGVPCKGGLSGPQGRAPWNTSGCFEVLRWRWKSWGWEWMGLAYPIHASRCFSTTSSSLRPSLFILVITNIFSYELILLSVQLLRCLYFLPYFDRYHFSCELMLLFQRIRGGGVGCVCVGGGGFYSVSGPVL